MQHHHHRHPALIWRPRVQSLRIASCGDEPLLEASLGGFLEAFQYHMFQMLSALLERKRFHHFHTINSVERDVSLNDNSKSTKLED